MVPQAMCNNINGLLEDCYGFRKEELFQPDKLPMTIGSTVASIFEQYIEKQFSGGESFSQISDQIAIPINVLKKKTDVLKSDLEVEESISSDTKKLDLKIKVTKKKTPKKRIPTETDKKKCLVD